MWSSRRKRNFFAQLAQRFSDAIALYVRYEYKDSTGETRRQRNARFGQSSPDIKWPDECGYLKSWFFEIKSGVKTGDIITWVDLKNWIDITGNLVTEDEILVIKEMDNAYCQQVSIEQSEDAIRNSPKTKGYNND